MAKPLLIIAILIVTGMQMTFAQEKAAFALYLLPRNIKANDLSKLNIKRLKPGGKPYLTAEDFSWYLKDTHEMTLHYQAGQRLKQLVVPAGGRPFIVFSGDEPVYTGTFRTRDFSTSFRGIFIDVSDLEGDFPLLKLELGRSPQQQKQNAADPRSDPRVLDAFQKRSVLREQVWMYGTCKKIRATNKRRQSFVFTFDVSAVVKGKYADFEVTFEIFDDIGKSLRSAVGAEWRRIDKSKIEWSMNSQEILLKFTRRVADNAEKVYLSDFEVKE